MVLVKANRFYYDFERHDFVTWRVMKQAYAVEISAEIDQIRWA